MANGNPPVFSLRLDKLEVTGSSPVPPIRCREPVRKRACQHRPHAPHDLDRRGAEHADLSWAGPHAFAPAGPSWGATTEATAAVILDTASAARLLSPRASTGCPQAPCSARELPAASRRESWRSAPEPRHQAE